MTENRDMNSVAEQLRQAEAELLEAQARVDALRVQMSDASQSDDCACSQEPGDCGCLQQLTDCTCTPQPNDCGRPQQPADCACPQQPGVFPPYGAPYGAPQYAPPVYGVPQQPTPMQETPWAGQFAQPHAQQPTPMQETLWAGQFAQPEGSQQADQQGYWPGQAPVPPYGMPQYNCVPMGYATKDHVAAGLLAIFLGTLGIHKFYLGYNTAGFIMLAITVLGGWLFGLGVFAMAVVSFIEGILYLTKTQADFERIYLMQERQWF